MCVCVCVCVRVRVCVRACVRACELALSCCPQVAVLKSLDHPNLLRFVGVLCNDSKEGKVLNIITGTLVCVSGKVLLGEGEGGSERKGV